MLKNLTPNLWVENVNASVDFYKDVLGFEFVLGVPVGTRDMVNEYCADKEIIHALVKRGPVEFMFHKTFDEEFEEFQGKTRGASMSLYIVVDNVDEFYEVVKKGTEVFKDIITQWYGMREFYIKDPDGYILGFATKV